LPDELRLILAFGLAVGLALAAVPNTIRVAVRTDFLDHPVGFKGHSRPTPYLGGVALMAAFLPPALIFGGGLSDFAAIIVCAVALSAVGTLDDRIGLGPLVRVVFETAAAVVLWWSGIGWFLFDSDLINLCLTVAWVVGLVNAFNLMDNADGAAGTVGMVSAAGASVLALIQGDAVLAALVIALSGACAGFLVFNLARPARVFFGDGGSMPLGFIIAAALLALPETSPMGTEVLIAVAPIAGLPILDTALVVFSRTRRGAPVLQGNRDHLAHRLRRWLPSARAVALALGVSQALLCGLGVTLFLAGDIVSVAGGAGYLIVGAALIVFLDWPMGRESPQPSMFTTQPAREESAP
jgi:UDP-GlcNAc:undecaprenyl-phosphate GlcNAc-1-phosphate transferase